MARPAKYSSDAILDAALELFVEGGPGAITVSGVAKHLGAPSGSIYHRFDRRIDLGAALWNRTVERFHETFLQALDQDCPRQAALDSARAVLSWCATYPGQAALLLAGPSAAGSEQWPAGAAQERDRQHELLMGNLKRLARRLKLPLRRVSFALVDLPYAAVRRQLRSPDPAWEQLAMEAIEALLQSCTPHGLPPVT